MKIAIISDVHDEIDKLIKAVDIMKNEKISYIFHCGDHVAPFSIQPLKELSIPVYAVLGNNDGEILGLSYKYNQLGKLSKPPKLYTIKDFNFLLLHEPFILQDLLSVNNFNLLDNWLLSKDYRAVFFGHTHKPFLYTNKQLIEIKYLQDINIDFPFILNPGAIKGRILPNLIYPSSFAIVDLYNKKVKFFKL